MQVRDQNRPRSLRHRSGNLLRVDLPCLGVEVHQNRCRLQAEDILKIRLKVVTGENDFIVRLNSQSTQRQFNGGRAAAAGKNVLHVMELGQSVAEFRQMGTMVTPPVP